jgi:hypothetical protein
VEVCFCRNCLAFVWLSCNVFVSIDVYSLQTKYELVLVSNLIAIIPLLVASHGQLMTIVDY